MRTLAELSSLRGRVALVAGGAGHIGRAAVDALAELGATVVVVDVDEAAVEEAVGPRPGGPDPQQVRGLVVDLTDDGAVAALPARVVEGSGRLDVVVHAAAFTGDSRLAGWTSPFGEQSLATWRSSMDVNLGSAFALAQASAPHLRRAGGGSMVLVSSIYGLVGPDLRLYEGTDMGNPAAYAAAKGGVVALARWLATVLAPDIRVNSISPGGVARGQPAPFVARYVDRTPLGRMATEEDLKGAVAFLASDLSSYVTGHDLVVDGGWTAW